MRRRRGGAAVVVASVAGKHDPPGLGHDGACRVAVVGCTSVLAEEVARAGIRGNAV